MDNIPVLGQKRPASTTYVAERPIDLISRHGTALIRSYWSKDITIQVIISNQNKSSTMNSNSRPCQVYLSIRIWVSILMCKTWPA